MEYKGILKERLILDSGKYNGYNYWIVSLGTHPCAYVELPKEHKYYGKCEGDAWDLNINVHGGITFGEFGLNGVADSDTFLLGWDYAHFGDYHTGAYGLCGSKKWTTKEIFEEVKDVIKQLKKVGLRKCVKNKRK